MDISFVILTWNSSQHIQNCLDSIIESLHNLSYSYEVFIIDNGSSDDSVKIINEYLSSHNDIIKPIFLDHNTGTTYSRNLAFKEAKGKYIVVIDSDIEINNNTLSTLIDTVENDETIGIVAPKLVYGNGLLQKSTDQFPTLWRKFYRYFFLKRIEQNEQQQTISEEPIEVDYAISAFWLMRKEIVDKVGYLDENIFYAPEDVDYCLRVWKQGFKIIFIPGSSAIHYAQEISRGFKINKATVEHLKGLIYFFIKHRYLFRKPKFSQSD